ncbi:MAG: hypothetical protein K1Y36_21720 [Blastocatellia bacterium]|nr:hypothetical protein [Blastocatellia bacterium]
MPKKRTSLDTLFIASTEPDNVQSPSTLVVESLENPPITPGKKKKPIVYQTLYLPVQVHEQLRHLAFVEHKKLHDYYLEGIDLVLKNRGLKSIAELTGEKK